MKFFYSLTVFLILFVTINPALISQDYNRPESIVYDILSKSYLISVVGEFSTDDGLIYKLKQDGTSTLFISSGLKDPKGMVIVDDILYVTDVTYLKAFDVSSGIETLNQSIDGSQFLNDICADSSGNLYITDMAKNKIYKFNIDAGELLDFEPDGAITSPNGILYDKRFERLVFVSFISPGTISEIKLNTMKANKLKTLPYNYFDGITIDNAGNFIISAWGSDSPTSTDDGTIHSLKGNLSGNGNIITTMLAGPADIFYNVHTDTLAIPQMNNGKLKFINYGPVTIASSPVLVSPTNNEILSDPNITFKWNFTVSADSYVIDVSTNEEFNPIADSKTIEDTTTMVMGLDINTKYYWRVKAVNSAGDGAWSKVSSFNISEPSYITPELLLPPNDTTCIDLYPTFKWSKSDVNIYTLQIDDEAEFLQPLTVEIKSLTVDTVYKLENFVHLLKNNKYYWRVKAYSGNQSSEWSETWSFSTQADPPAIPPLNQPFKNEEGLPLRTSFEWSKTVNTDYYQLAVSTDDFYKDSTLYEVQPGATLEMYQLAEELEPNAFYYWKVRGMNSCVTGLWSETRKFKTTLLELDKPELLSPAHEGDAQPNQEFRWGEVSGAVNYRVHISETVVFEEIIENSVITTNSVKFPDTNWEIGKDYYWRVMAMNGDITSDWSEIFKFTIVPLSVHDDISNISGSLIFPNPAGDAASLSLTLKTPAQLKIELYNSLGQISREIFDGKPDGLNFILPIQLDNLDNGFYFIKIISGNDVGVLKLVVVE